MECAFAVILSCLVAACSAGLPPSARDRDPKSFFTWLDSLNPFARVEPVECNAANGVLGVGTCYQESACLDIGGVSSGACEGGGVCCVIPAVCGSVIKQNRTWFLNKDFPDETSDPGRCIVTVQKASPEVKQLRLDFQALVLDSPRGGRCLGDAMRVVRDATSRSDDPGVSLTPTLCGENTGHHFIVDLDDREEVTVEIQLDSISRYKASKSEPSRKWQILISQFDEKLRVPKGCLQYFQEDDAKIFSLNYNVDDIFTDDLNYDICFSKLKRSDGQKCFRTFKDVEVSQTPSFRYRSELIKRKKGKGAPVSVVRRSLLSISNEQEEALPPKSLTSEDGVLDRFNQVVMQLQGEPRFGSNLKENSLKAEESIENGNNDLENAINSLTVNNSSTTKKTQNEKEATDTDVSMNDASPIEVTMIVQKTENEKSDSGKAQDVKSVPKKSPESTKTEEQNKTVSEEKPVAQSSSNDITKATAGNGESSDNSKTEIKPQVAPGNDVKSDSIDNSKTQSKPQVVPGNDIKSDSSDNNKTPIKPQVAPGNDVKSDSIDNSKRQSKPQVVPGNDVKSDSSDNSKTPIKPPVVPGKDVESDSLVTSPNSYSIKKVEEDKKSQDIKQPVPGNNKPVVLDNSAPTKVNKTSYNTVTLDVNTINKKAVNTKTANNDKPSSNSAKPVNSEESENKPISEADDKILTDKNEVDKMDSFKPKDKIDSVVKNNEIKDNLENVNSSPETNKDNEVDYTQAVTDNFAVETSLVEAVVKPNKNSNEEEKESVVATKDKVGQDKTESNRVNTKITEIFDKNKENINKKPLTSNVETAMQQDSVGSSNDNKKNNKISHQYANTGIPLMEDDKKKDTKTTEATTSLQNENIQWLLLEDENGNDETASNLPPDVVISSDIGFGSDKKNVTASNSDPVINSEFLENVLHMTQNISLPEEAATTVSSPAVVQDDVQTQEEAAQPQEEELLHDTECGGSFIQVFTYRVCSNKLRSGITDNTNEDERFKNVERISIKSMPDATRSLRFNMEYSTECRLVEVDQETSEEGSTDNVKRISLIQYLLGWY